MATLKVIVQGGQAVINNLEEYPDGTELEVVVVENENDQMSEEERAKLHASLDTGLAQARAGQTRPAEEVLAKLFAKA